MLRLCKSHLRQAVQVRVDLKVDGLEEALVLGHAQHQVHMVVLAPVHQLGRDVGEEVAVNDAGAAEHLLDAERLLAA